MKQAKLKPKRKKVFNSKTKGLIKKIKKEIIKKGNSTQKTKKAVRNNSDKKQAVSISNLMKRIDKLEKGLAKKPRIKRKASKYASYVGKVLKSGGTIKDAAKSWKEKNEAKK